MSCWVAPAVAAEYWGITLDTVWQRISDGLIPHMTDSGFVFVDVDPWRPDADGIVPHQLPPTFVPATGDLNPLEQPQADLAEGLEPDEAECLSVECTDDPLWQQGADEEDEDLPTLDEEETATFGRLTWQEVRQQVGRTRRPPTVLA